MIAHCLYLEETKLHFFKYIYPLIQAGEGVP